VREDAAISPDHPDGVLSDLLMGVMNSLEIWSKAAHDDRRALAWRDAVTARMIAAKAYAPYEDLVADAAIEAGLSPGASAELFDRWSSMEPWPDAAALSRLTLPYAFVTNCSAELAGLAARRSGLDPRFTLSAQEAGWFKPDARIYREACRRLGSTVKRTLLVAGSPYDAVGARAAGLPTWLVLRRSDQRAPGESISVARSLAEVVEAINRP
jgi:2-haloacid dehalogenase